jgi:hypothetical protein
MIAVHWQHSCASCQRLEGARSHRKLHNSLQSVLYSNRCSNGHPTLSRLEDFNIGAERRRTEPFRSEIFRDRLGCLVECFVLLFALKKREGYFCQSEVL